MHVITQNGAFVAHSAVSDPAPSGTCSGSPTHWARAGPGRAADGPAEGVWPQRQPARRAYRQVRRPLMRNKNLVKPILAFNCFAPETTVATAVAWRAWTYRAGNSRMKIWS
jgi:hypothetical protein